MTVGVWYKIDWISVWANGKGEGNIEQHILRNKIHIYKSKNCPQRMPRRRLSSDGFKLFNMAYSQPPTKEGIRRFLTCLFRTEYDDRLEEMSDSCHRTQAVVCLLYRPYKKRVHQQVYRQFHIQCDLRDTVQRWRVCHQLSDASELSLLYGCYRGGT